MRTADEVRLEVAERVRGGLLGTPSATDWKGGSVIPTMKDGTSRDQFLRHYLSRLYGGTAYPSPAFLEEMMGFPIGYTMQPFLNEAMNEKTKDWTGDTAAVFRALGAPGKGERAERDYYATEPKAAEWLLRIERVPIDRPVWECAAGELHLSRVFSKRGYEVISTDIETRTEGVSEYDFLQPVNDGRFGKARCTIVTNPPYRHSMEFVERALQWVAEGEKVCMFLRLQFLEGKGRGEFYRRCPPKKVWVSSSRIKCARNGDFDAMEGSVMCFAWFVWEKGWKGSTEIGWFN